MNSLKELMKYVTNEYTITINDKKFTGYVETHVIKRGPLHAISSKILINVFLWVGKSCESYVLPN